MYYKGIVMDIKDKYCIAMDNMGAVYRIGKKREVNVGDKIYFLDEDVITESITAASGYMGNNKMMVSSGRMRRIGAFVAALVIFIGAIGMVEYDNVAYAAISLDAEQSIQLELNRDGEVVGITSFGKKLSEEEMQMYKDLTMEEFWKLFASHNTDKDFPFMVSYVALRGGRDTEAQVEEDIRKYMVGKNIVVLKGAQADVEKADEKNMSLGQYIFSTYDDNEKLEEFLEYSSKESVEKYLKEHPKQISDKEAQEILNMKNEIERENEENENDDDASSNHRPNKPSQLSKPSKPSKPPAHQTNPGYDNDDDDDNDNDDPDEDDVDTDSDSDEDEDSDSYINEESETETEKEVQN